MIRDLFEQETAALWDDLRRLSDATPRLQGLYTRDADPRVARLVQSAAFALSSARARLDDGGQALLRPLVAAALPETLRPRPASTIVQLSGATGRVGTASAVQLAADASGQRVPFEVMWPTTLAPVAIENVTVDRVHAQLQVLRFDLSGANGVSLGRALPDPLRLFVHLEPRATALDLIHALRSAEGRMSVRSFSSQGTVLSDLSLARVPEWVRIDTDEPPLSCASDRFASSTLLRDLFHFPESFCFFQLRLPELRDPRIARAEITLPLARIVPGAERLAADGLRLHCAPATNQFAASIAPLRVADPERQWPLTVARRPHAEILEVRSLYTESVRDAGRRVELRSWEAPSSPHRFEPDDTFYLLAPRGAVADDRTELLVSFATLRATRVLPPGSVVQGESVASDGALADGIGVGEVSAGGDGGANITRVAPSRRAPLRTHEGWRLNAYARMPANELARRLDAFLSLHENPVLAEAGVRIGRPRFSALGHDRAHTADGAGLRWGDVFHFEVDPAQCSEGEVWLAGALLHRALAERNERLRFCKVVLSRQGEPVADYEPRDGERLPFPFG